MIAVFRPDDGRLAEAVAFIESLGAEAIGDAMLEVRPTGNAPREDGDFTVLTSKTGVELAAEAGWNAQGTICAVGEGTANRLRDFEYPVHRIPEEYSSAGLVEALADDVDGARVEVARSDHGSPVLTDGLEEAGAYVHETVLYELVRPEGAGASAEAAATGDLTGAIFTSSLMVQHFLDAAEERGIRDEALAGLNEAVVGVIGEPTKSTAEGLGIEVGVVPEKADFKSLARAVVEATQAN
ncbi:MULTISPECIES: uroporphyrinogen-III synthase [unclassified Haladaptatus]|uniref:uroporphyrinogen-III synthase n=1 Tax=unclassified Haladaptatus TaxID=2622732 RepID=UPI0023E76075|nr:MULTISPECIES: uroporphyrinogen-III synthase [unclassified Haladaptatus]